MGNELQVINQQEALGKTFKVYGDINQPLFLAKDVANWIEHNKPAEMLGTVDPEEKLKAILSLSGQNRNVWFITKDGLYEVFMQSRKPMAKQFKKKVKEILKTIRQTGSYVAFNVPQTYPEALRLAATLAEENQALKPKAENYDLLISAENYENDLPAYKQGITGFLLSVRGIG